MPSPGRAILNTIFWSYERGSWPYDVMVMVILAFVLLTPAKWFHDQPQQTKPAGNLIQMVVENSANGSRTYRIDATLVPPEKRAVRSNPELERVVHDVLSRTIDDLEGQTFQIRRIDPVFSSDGAVLYYDVTIHL